MPYKNGAPQGRKKILFAVVFLGKYGQLILYGFDSLFRYAVQKSMEIINEKNIILHSKVLLKNYNQSSAQIGIPRPH